MRVLVLVGNLNEAAKRRIAYAGAMGGARAEALHVPVDDNTAAALRGQWRDEKVPLRLTIVAPSGHEIAVPVLDYVRDLRRTSPEELIAVLVPQFHGWWANLVHGWRTRRLAIRLARLDGVAIVLVPSQPEEDAE